MTEREVEEETLSESELDADRPNALLQESLTEAKAERVPGRDWSAVDEALFARIEREKAASKRAERSRVVWLSFGGAMAVAAAALLYVGGQPPAIQPVATHDPAVGTLVSANGAAVTVSGAQVADGHSLKSGDVIAVSGGNAVFAQEGKVRFSIESGSEVSVAHPSAPLILALAIGATEADVTPVPSGDAFAVDVAAQSGAVARVAVHGTHLRVARAGDHVVVDLTDGVVSIGVAGADQEQRTIVHAPAHVEFEATDAAHTVVINRAADAVRAADTTVHQASAAPKATVAAVHPPIHPSPGAVSAVKPVESAAPAAIVDPERALSQAVQSCIVSVPTSTQVSLTFESKLSLRLADDGTVQSALFDPPLPVEARECAARAIYQKGLFSHSGDVTVPITVRR